MTRVHNLAIDDPFPPELANGAVSIGNFDGVHRGHQSLIRTLLAEARRLGGPAVVVTFDPHPLRLLAPERFMPVLTTIHDRAELLLGAGADRVVVLQTALHLLQLDAQSFLEKLILKQLHAHAVVEGFNFAFGRDRTGSTEFLRNWCAAAGIACSIVPPFKCEDGGPVSSSRVRDALNRGDVVAATQLLGRPYRLHGTVIVGDRRGTSLGFPTANLDDCAIVVPGDGVYAVRVVINSRTFAGACNVGPNPTFGVADKKVEVHVIDFAGDLYDQSIALDFIVRLRPTQAFGSKNELIHQLHQDVDSAKRAIDAAVQGNA